MKEKKHINIPLIENYYRIHEDGSVYSHRKNRLLKTILNTAGYLFVHLQIDDNREASRFYAVHRLVATKFIGECPPDKETSHKDGNKLNNHYTNLEYISHADNQIKAFKEHGRISHRIGVTLSAEHTEKLASSRRKPVIYTNYQTGEITRFISATETAKSPKADYAKINVCLRDAIPFISRKYPHLNGDIIYEKAEKTELAQLAINNTSIS